MFATLRHSCETLKRESCPRKCTHLIEEKGYAPTSKFDLTTRDQPLRFPVRRAWQLWCEKKNRTYNIFFHPWRPLARPGYGLDHCSWHMVQGICGILSKITLSCGCGWTLGLAWRLQPVHSPLQVRNYLWLLLRSLLVDGVHGHRPNLIEGYLQ